MPLLHSVYAVHALCESWYHYLVDINTVPFKRKIHVCEYSYGSCVVCSGSQLTWFCSIWQSEVVICTESTAFGEVWKFVARFLFSVYSIWCFLNRIVL